MNRVIRIGTRDSELALWQANDVKQKLEIYGYQCELIPVKSDGDLNLDQPLYTLGITGIFTKTLDMALLRNEIDIAVHSMKDVPTVLPQGLTQAAVLERANPADVLVHKGLDFLNTEGIVATGSLRRKAQWLHRYPMHELVELRGNVNTRLQKLQDNAWNAAIFASAGLQRLGLIPENATNLQWMIPAPAQGAMVVLTKDSDSYCKEALAQINHESSEKCTRVEREFLQILEGGCTAPIGGLARLTHEGMQFKGVLLSLNGQQRIIVEKQISSDHLEGFGKACAKEILNNGGVELMREIKQQLQK